MPQDGFGHVPCATIVKQPCVLVDSLLQSDAPQRLSAPLSSCRLKICTTIGECRTHVMQQQIREWMNRLTTEPGLVRHIVRREGRAMTRFATRTQKQPRTLLHLWCIEIASRGHGE